MDNKVNIDMESLITLSSFEVTEEDKKVYEVNLDIVCEKPNHKAILIGKGGKAIKEVSSFARADMEKFLGKKVFLTTYVKIKEDWRNSASLLRELGYSENDR
jgi:GTP-binding protein Era